MKKLFFIATTLSFVACAESKKVEPSTIKKVVCADSIDTEMFDETGTAYTVRIPGKCDTIIETVPAE